MELLPNIGSDEPVIPRFIKLDSSNKLVHKYSCARCVRLKRKCDRLPVCTRCTQMKVECVYNYNPEGKRPYHHIITSKFDNCVKKFEDLLDIVDKASLVKRGTKEQVLNWITNQNDLDNLQYFLQDNLGFIYLNLNTLNLSTATCKVVPYSMTQQMIEIFVNNIYPSNPFINLDKIYQLPKQSASDNPLLIAILFRSQLLLSNLQSPNQPVDMENLYFYKLACHYFANSDNIPSLELLQAILLLCGIELQYLSPRVKMRLAKCIQMGHMLNIFDYEALNNSKEPIVTKLEKCATGFMCSVVDLKMAFTYRIPRFKFNKDYLTSINIETSQEDTTIQRAKFWTHVMLLQLYLAEYTFDIINWQKSSKKNISDPNVPPLTMEDISILQPAISFVSQSTISKLPSSILTEPGPSSDPNHSAKVILSLCFNFLQLYLCDVGDLVSNSEYYQTHDIPDIIQELMDLRCSRLNICEKILAFANRSSHHSTIDQFSSMTPPPSPIDSVNIIFHPLELSEVRFTYAYFIVIQSFVSRGSFLQSTRLTHVVNKLRILSNVWPISKGLYDLVSRQHFQYSYTVSFRDLSNLAITEEME